MLSFHLFLASNAGRADDVQLKPFGLENWRFRAHTLIANMLGPIIFLCQHLQIASSVDVLLFPMWFHFSSHSFEYNFEHFEYGKLVFIYRNSLYLNSHSENSTKCRNTNIIMEIICCSVHRDKFLSSSNNFGQRQIKKEEKNLSK